MPFILFLIAGAVVGTMISCLATDDSLNSGQNTGDRPADQPRDDRTNIGHSNGGVTPMGAISLTIMKGIEKATTADVQMEPTFTDQSGRSEDSAGHTLEPNSR